MVGGGELKIATVETVESVDNMATLPVSCRVVHGAGNDVIAAEKNNAMNKEMELKKVQPKPDKRYFFSTHHDNIIEVKKNYIFILFKYDFISILKS